MASGFQWSSQTQQQQQRSMYLPYHVYLLKLLYLWCVLALHSTDV